MTEAEAVWQSHLFFILPHPTESRVLMVRGEDGYALPHVYLAERLWLPLVGSFSQAVASEWKLRPIVLRAPYEHTDKGAHHAEAIYLLEPLPLVGRLSDEARWMGAADLAELPALPAAHRATIETALAERDGAVPPAQRPPWAYAGWFAGAAAWIEQEAARHGLSLLGPVEQVKTWGISCILRAPTEQGALYFKVASDSALFGNEPAVTAWLAECYPDRIPIPLAVQPDRRWMLLAEFGPALHETPMLDSWMRALALFGQMQVEHAGQVDALLARGFVDRRLERLAEQVGPLLEDPLLPSLLEQGELGPIQSLAPRLHAMCAELATFRVPPSLVHGDLHPGNIAMRGAQPLFFDWTDACVAHPFLDLVTLMGETDSLPESDAWDRLLESYLALWLDFEPLERLQQAWALARPLGCLHQAVSYQHIIASLEPSARWELRSGLSYWLRKLVEALPPISQSP